jgi:hypothetical protein
VIQDLLSYCWQAEQVNFTTEGTELTEILFGLFAADTRHGEQAFAPTSLCG